MRTTAATLFLSLAVVGTAGADVPPQPYDPARASAAAAIADPAAATQAYLDAVPAERRAKTKAYALGDYVLDVVEFAWLATVLAALALYAVLRRAPRTWWLWGAAVVIAFLVFGMVVGPVFVAPLFNTFTPVADRELRDRVLAMARAEIVEKP